MVMENILLKMEMFWKDNGPMVYSINNIMMKLIKKMLSKFKNIKTIQIKSTKINKEKYHKYWKMKVRIKYHK